MCAGFPRASYQTPTLFAEQAFVGGNQLTRNESFQDGFALPFLRGDLFHSKPLQFFARVSQHVGGAPVDGQDAALEVKDEDRIVGLLEDGFVAQFRLFAPHHLPPLLQRMHHGGSQTADVLLDDVVHRAGFHALHGGILPHRTGPDDERRQRRVFESQFQRLHAVETRHAEIGQDQVGLESPERIQKILARLNQSKSTVLHGFTDLAPGKLEIRFQILHDQNANGVTHNLFPCCGRDEPRSFQGAVHQ
jgi:hypothetical protein